MNAGYDRATGSLSLCFTPNESWEAAVLMQLVWEDEWRKGTAVPDFSDDFFRQLALAKKETPLEFEFEYLEFVIAFLEESCTQSADNDGNTAGLKKFLAELHGYCSVGQKIH